MLNGSSKPLEERYHEANGMLEGLMDLQAGRSYVALPELETLDNMPTAKVIEAMGMKVEDMSRPINFEQMKEPPPALHDCSFCQARVSL